MITEILAQTIGVMRNEFGFRSCEGKLSLSSNKPHAIAPSRAPWLGCGSH
jgi:hypothetical protein